MVVLVSGGLSEGSRPFSLKILDTKISVNSTSGECIISTKLNENRTRWTLFRVKLVFEFDFKISQGFRILEISWSFLDAIASLASAHDCMSVSQLPICQIVRSFEKPMKTLMKTSLKKIVKEDHSI